MSRVIAILASALIISGAGLPALAENQALIDAMKAYRKNDYKAAATNFASALKSPSYETRSAAVHYYYADSLLHLGRRQAALAEYQRCLKLQPYGKLASFAKKAVAELKKDAANVAKEEEAAKLKAKAGETAAERAKPSVKLKEDPKLEDFGINKASMPTLTEFRDGGPRPKDVAAWDFWRQVEYRQEAGDRLQQAERALKTANANLDRAKYMLSSIVPTTPNKRETKDQFAERVEIAKAQQAALLKPYRDEKRRLEMMMDNIRRVNKLVHKTPVSEQDAIVHQQDGLFFH